MGRAEALEHPHSDKETQMITRPRLAACPAGFLRLGWGYLPSIPVIHLCGQSDRQIDDGPRSTPQRPLVCIDDEGGSCPIPVIACTGAYVSTGKRL
jgi:hypothetical protein